MKTLRQQVSADGRGTLSARFLEMIDDPTFPCVGSKAALARDAIEPCEFDRLGSRHNDASLLDALTAFARSIDAAPADDTTVRSFVALFDGPFDADEQRFEAILWSQLQRLHDLDTRRGTPWARDVSRDPDDPRFSLSLAGHPFFVIGLHPGASRIARRFEAPAMVFNSHRQFDRLRADGRYAKMQAATRQRDIALQGSINPNLADFGTAPETRQYSGRRVEADWRCPFHVRRPR
ncbi:guanitoxin biosynthesis heme-dependent pre-guanitoxin N-hydroxylase GntA [Luteimonas kalidii]|uniref:Guanitoxin biosynthesis heme-dependent pre-guanitoxin N-hydroxylase GntA n=1 Tax=Luteimonas kalidii TaxID=3042025 RepID=A0ABT6JRY7_9GAMM|nr:guanitoxin biosynthesis heme-dependent pre-guanitoxin N-hydroxylase GntA [Luteimonas kalidii]MDH5833456.1 guanitoxin biosynthesis heme-dependent pre-guanitoxin N-hydroxylase GntA [Luteimonas kalidii]